jgi:hypothetical protein
MKKIFMVLSMVVLLCGAANADALKFDPDGAGNYVSIEAFGLESNAEAIDTPVGAHFNSQDLWSYEDAAGNFTEHFTLQISNMDLSNGGGQFTLSQYGIYVDVAIAGWVDHANEKAYFYSGAATIYKDNDGNLYTPNATDNYDIGVDTKIADLAFVSGDMPLTETVLDLNLSGQIDMTFKFTEVNPDFWGPDEVNWVNADWVFSLMAGRIDVSDIVGPNGNGITAIGWDTDDIDAEFNVVPEPSTILLLGCGLIGVAAIGRKKLSK